jgi:prefoldin subunit 5
LPPIPAGSTLFEFTHPLFGAPEARFVLGSDGRPCMGMKLGTLDALVPLSSLVKEFNLEGTPDGLLLETVIAGLKYVKTIRPGDSIPRELLDGTASWRVDDEHKEIAEGRVTLQLNGWLNGQERLVVDPIEILQLVEDPAVVARVKGGYPRVAERLGLAGEKEVRPLVDKLTRELVYIEALRARFTSVQQLQGKIAAFRRVYRKDKTIDEELIRVNNLLFKPIDLFNKAFADVDGHCGEIITVLRNLDRTITYIRESRDALHARLMSWDDILKRWTEVKLEVSVANEGMIKELYRFLAQNYLTTKSW